MYELDLGFDNTSIYRGCEVRQDESGKHRLKTPLDSALVILAQNLPNLLGTIPLEDRDTLVLTGAVPPAIYLTAQSILGPHFKEVVHFDGNRKVTVTIPTPPEHFQGEAG